MTKNFILPTKGDIWNLDQEVNFFIGRKLKLNPDGTGIESITAFKDQEKCFLGENHHEEVYTSITNNFGLSAITSTPKKGYFKKSWEDLLQGAFLNHKGIIDTETGILITNTVPFFQKIIGSFGLEKEITIKVTPTKEIHFMGAVLSKRVPNPNRPGESMFLRHEKFIREINRVRLAHVVVRYKSKQ